MSNEKSQAMQDFIDHADAAFAAGFTRRELSDVLDAVRKTDIVRRRIMKQQNDGDEDEQ